MMKKIFEFFRKGKTKSDDKNLIDKIEHIYSYLHNLKVNLQSTTDKLKERIQAESKERENLQHELHSYLAMQSVGIDSNSVPLSRFIPVRVYLSVSAPIKITEVSDAISLLLDILGFEISDSFPAELGSWWKRWFAKSKDVITQPEVVEKLQKAERALELYTLQRYQSTVDKEQAEAAGAVLKSLDNIPNAVCQIGSILIIKITDDFTGTRVYSRTLSAQEMIYLERNQHLLQSPEKILECLSQHCNSQTHLPFEEGGIDQI
jgi:hypothetical protein